MRSYVHSKTHGELNIWDKRPAYSAKGFKWKLWMTLDTVLSKGSALNSSFPSRGVKPAKHYQWIWQRDLECLLLKSPIQMLLGVITTRNFIVYWLSRSQIPEGNLGVFSYFPGRQTGNRNSIFAGLQTKTLLNVGSPSVILLFRSAHFKACKRTCPQRGLKTHKRSLTSP